MKLYYIIYEDFIKERASNVQISNTTNFLNSPGIDVNLIFPYKFEMPDRYKIKSNIIFLFNKTFSKFNKLNILKFSLKLFSYLRKVDSDSIVYFRHVVLLPVILLVKLFLPKLKIVYEIHREVNDSFGKYCEKKLIKKGIKLITISDSLKQSYQQQYGVKENKIQVVHDAVDLETFDININQFEARKKAHVEEKATVMYIGSLWTVKGVDILLGAAKKLPEYNFYFVGKEHADFVDLRKEFENLSNVFIKGMVPHQEVPVLQKAADLLVIPHPKNNLSQSPMKLFEYLASNTPILSVDLDNIREILPGNSLFFEPENLDDVVVKIKDYFTHQADYINKAKNNIEIARKYSWQNRSKLIKDFINN
ncbi:MAG: glycosyltransferase family 4 protein [Patescibacteria group bacterium]|jgi:glycosyltransferase involved in cell wall biosynthesis